MKKILFFNDWHNGDIHMSRSYIRDLMNILGDNEYYSFHLNNPEILCDIPNLKHIKTKNGFDITINTWVAQYRETMGFHGCNFLYYYDTMKILYDNLGIIENMKNIEEYIPYIDFTQIDTKNCDEFLNRRKKFLLVCNNDVHSGQSDNFDMSHLINLLSDQFKEYNILVTNFNNNIIRKDNVIFCHEITKKENNFDLNEISYLSTFSNIIVGRSSGPYSFSVVQENYKRKVPYICLVNKKYDCWYTNDDTNVIWSDFYNTENIINLIKQNVT